MRRNFSALQDGPFDVLVIGGGATGAAIALDATLRGLRVALIDKGDFSAATSAGSTKLMHGGLRYLANGEFALVREGLRERHIWQRVAKHLVRPLPFILPIYATPFRQAYKQPFKQRKWAMRAGLTAYDMLAFGRNIGTDPMQRMPGFRTLNAAQTLGLMPHLSQDGLTGGMIYHDGQMLSPERLCLAVLRTAVEAGATIVNYATATAFNDTGRSTGSNTGQNIRRRIDSVTVKDGLSRKKLAVRASCVINATGPWADLLMQAAGHAAPPKKLIRSKGIHFVTADVTRGTALMVPIGPMGDAHLFVLPWQGMSLFATTDTQYDGDPNKVCVTTADIDLLLAKVTTALPGLQLTRADIIYAYAGLRPLVADFGAGSATDSDAPNQEAHGHNTYGMSRGSEILDHETQGGPAGLISALGGKWTTSRRLGEQIVDLVMARLGARPGRTTPACRTDKTVLACAPRDDLGHFMGQMRDLFSSYDTNKYDTGEIDRLSCLYGRLLPLLKEQAIDGLEELKDPLLAARISFALDHEMAMMLDDVVLRRLVEGQTGELKKAQINIIAAYMAARMGWSDSEKTRQLARTNKALRLPKTHR